MEKRIIENSRVLVTGGAGFIGSNLVEDLLNQNNEVVCLDNLETGKYENIRPFENNKQFNFIEGDIRDLEICKKAVDCVDYVLNQAALGSVPRSIKDPVRTNSNNVDGFLNMILAAKEAKVKRFVFASSSSVYGDNYTLPKEEDKIGKPLSPYAVSKYTNELYAHVFGGLFEMETIGLRYFNVFGKRQDPYGAYAAVIPKFIKAMLEGESPIINGDGSQSRDFTYIKNVIQVNQLAAVTQNQEALNTIYNVAVGEESTLLELYRILQELLSASTPEVMNINPVHGPEREGDIPRSLASIEKAATLLGYNPTYNLRQGLEETIDWYCSELK